MGDEELSYPVDKRVKDLERMMDVQRTRAEALHHARKSWAAACDVGQNVTDHARSVTRIAQAFEKYLTDGTVHPADGGRAPLEASPTPVSERRFSYPHVQTVAVLDAALAWVDQSRTHNPSGPENWRNWADDHDVDLINAVLAYRGLPPLERVKP